MKKSIIILAILMCNLSIISCDSTDVSDEISIEELATEGEEGEMNEDPDADWVKPYFS